MVLINAYKDKWYNLCHRNLRFADWDSVASDLFSRCPPSVIPVFGAGDADAASSTVVAKSSAQCRHKMERLRKRYRTEKQRAPAHPNCFFAFSWIFFDLMDSMETGSCSNGGSGPNLGNQTDVNLSTIRVLFSSFTFDRIKHIYILHDPLEDTPELAGLIPDASPERKTKR